MGSKNGIQIGGPDFGGLPQIVAPRQFCFDTLDARGPRSARGPCGGHLLAFSKIVSKMGSENGVQKWGPNMGSKMGSKKGVQHGFKMVSKNGFPKGFQNGIQLGVLGSGTFKTKLIQLLFVI